MNTVIKSLTLFIITGLTLCSCGIPMKRGYSVPKRAIGLDAANKAYSSYTSKTRYDYVNDRLPDDEASTGWVENPDYFRVRYDQAAAGLPRQRVRNEIVKEMAALVDENHSIYHESLRRNMTGTNIISDFVTMGLTSAGAISTGAHATKALSALATGTKGFGATINGHILQQQTLSVIIKAIHLKKEKVYAEMAANFNKNTDEYSLEDVLRDLGRYWEAGLLISGIAEIDTVVSTKAEKVEKEKNDTSGGSPAPAGASAPEKASGDSEVSKAKRTLRAFNLY